MNTWVCNQQKILSLPETNSSPLKIGLPNRKVVFQPSIFRGYSLVSGRVSLPKPKNMDIFFILFLWLDPIQASVGLVVSDSCKMAGVPIQHSANPGWCLSSKHIVLNMMKITIFRADQQKWRWQILPPHRMPVTTKIITFLIGNPNLNLHLPRLHPVRGPHPTNLEFGSCWFHPWMDAYGKSHPVTLLKIHKLHVPRKKWWWKGCENLPW